MRLRVCQHKHLPRHLAGCYLVGAEVGVVPQFKLIKDLRFGGVEVGFDTISSVGNNQVKPVLNGKLGLVTEGEYFPAVAAGIAEISPGFPSMNFVCVSATKTLHFGDIRRSDASRAISWSTFR